MLGDELLTSLGYRKMDETENKIEYVNGQKHSTIGFNKKFKTVYKFSFGMYGDYTYKELEAALRIAKELEFNKKEK